MRIETLALFPKRLAIDIQKMNVKTLNLKVTLAEKRKQLLRIILDRFVAYWCFHKGRYTKLPSGVQASLRILSDFKSEKLIDNQQYFVDESTKIYISYYTNDLFTPMLIGRNGILEDMENGNLKMVLSL